MMSSIGSPTWRIRRTPKSCRYVAVLQLVPGQRRPAVVTLADLGTGGDSAGPGDGGRDRRLIPGADQLAEPQPGGQGPTTGVS